MVLVRLKGVHIVRAGKREYHYAWRGGPRLTGEPGSPEYVTAYNDAHAARKAPVTGTFKEVLTAYKASPKFKKLRPATTRDYERYLKLIDARFGSLPKVALDDPRVRRHFLKWRDEMSDRPRAADMGIGVLKTVLGWAVENVHVSSNQAEPISRLHSVNKSDDIWTADDVAAFLKHAPKELAWVLQLAIYTGFRQSDLIRLAWNHETDGAFDLRTQKRKRDAMVPITPGCRTLLNRIEKRGPIILTTKRGKQPWTADGLRTSFGDVCREAGVERTFHDLRRTAATNLLAMGLDSSQVAMVMGWSEKDVETLKRKYVSRQAVIKAVLAKLEKEV